MKALGLGADRIDPRKTGAAAILTLAYVLSIWASLTFHAPGQIPPFWVCDAFLAAAVVLIDGPVLWLAFAICAVASFPIMAPHWRAWQIGLVRISFNMVEGATTGLLARWALGPRRLLRTTPGFLRLQLLAVAPAVLINLVLRESLLRLLVDPHLALSMRDAIPPHLLGMATVLPAMLLLFQPSPLEIKRPWYESAGVLAGLALITYLIIHQARLPAAFVISPLLLITAFRLGPKGSVFGHLIVVLMVLPATVYGLGPFSLHPEWTLQDRALIYQAMMLSSLFGVSVCAFTVADHARLRRLLTRRAIAARAARLRALEASRSKTEFLATMSHEIRTPMNSILGFTQLLLHNDGVSKEAHEQIKVIAEAGGSLMTVLNDILDFSKVEAGQIELHLEPVDVAAALAAAVEIMREPARTRGLTLRLEAEGVQGRFTADGQRLRQILLNLLNNAVKFTSQGHVLLSATHEAERGVLRFEVSDTGIGIDPAVQARLFTRFSQADSSTTRHYGGSGLGLAICKGLAECMGGSIGVESRTGEGSTFWFEIPAVPVETVVGQAAGNQRPTRRLSCRVLLVDDHPMNRRLGQTLLNMLGCEVDMAASGEEAVEAARARDYDAILMDVHMPSMDGFAATRAIQALDGASARAPVIAMSADVMPQNIERCRQAGMVEHIAKPVQLLVLHEALKRWTAPAKRRSAA